MSLKIILFIVATPLWAQQDDQLTPRERMLLDKIDQLEKRLSVLEARSNPAPLADPAPVKDVPPELTLNFNLDGYYGYNFNRPLDRVNLLRANDVSSNSFTLGQADVVVERAPDPNNGRRFGVRLDLMFGQNTETLQGNPANEPRPQVYRNLFQAYGTYVFPIGNGLIVDFGKFASSLGYENNYTKDQFNYSRSYYFNALPFYHMGFRTTYKFNDKLTAQYWLVNGANQTEDFNGFKSNAFLFTVAPTPKISWNINYYVGQEGRISNGRLHIFDTYASFAASSKLTLAAEADYLINRTFSNSAPARVTGGIGYAKYQFAPKFNLAGRFEYLSDRGGFFSGATQALKDATLTATLQPADGFQMRWEYRRDFSNRPFFNLKKEQNTALMGLIWWFGGKQGPW
jgi:putative OmpL-like beta-barrel porin-2